VAKKGESPGGFQNKISRVGLQEKRKKKKKKKKNKTTKSCGKEGSQPLKTTAGYQLEKRILNVKGKRLNRVRQENGSAKGGKGGPIKCLPKNNEKGG